MKKTRLLILVLSLALLITGALGIGTAAADGENTFVTIKDANLSFMNEPRLVFAVEHDGAASAVKLNVWNSAPAENQSPDYVVTESFEKTVGDKTYTVLPVEGKNPTDIYDYVWVQAEADGVKSDVIRYSILQYALGGVFMGGETEKMFQSIIDYSASAQKWTEITDTNGKTADEYVYVTVEGGKVDGYRNSVYPVGSVVTPVADGEIAAWDIYGADGEKIGSINAGESVTLEAHTRIAPVADSYTVMDYNSGIYSDYVKSFLSDGTPIESNYGTSSGSNLFVGRIEGENSYLQVRNYSAKTAYTKVMLSNTVQIGECYSFETKLYINGATAGNSIAKIKFMNNNGGEAVNLMLSTEKVTTQGLKIATTGSNASVAAGTALFDTEDEIVEVSRWATIRVEFYFPGADASASQETKDKCFLKLYVNGNLYYSDNANWAVGANISHVEIEHIASTNKAYNVFFDDIYFTRTNKAYTAD